MSNREEEKDDISKIDEQIQDILDSSLENQEEDDGHVIFVDRKYAYDSVENQEIPLEDTKELDSIESIEENTSKEEEQSKDIPTTEEKLSKKGNQSLEKPSKRKKKIIWCIILFAFFIIVGFLLFHFVFSKSKTVDVEKEKTLSKSEQEEIINDYGEALEGIVAVYFQKQNVLLEYEDAIKLVDLDYKVECLEHEIYTNGLIYLNQCSINNKKTRYSYGIKQEVEELSVSDEAIFVYVSKDSKLVTLKEPKNLENYDVYSFEIDGAYSDLTVFDEYDGSYVFYYDENYYVQMINFKTGKKVLNPLSYTSVLPIEESDGYNPTYIAVNINDKWGIYNIETRERVVSHIYDSVSVMLYMGTSGPAFSISSLEYGKIAVYKDGYYGVIDYQNGKTIIPLVYKSMLKSGNYLWAVDDKNQGHILDYSNNEYLNAVYDEVYGFVDGKYVLVKDSDTVKIIQLDGKVLYDYGKLEFGPLNYALGYNGALFSFYKTEDTTNYDECFEITYDPSTKKGEAKDFMCGGIAKPILYLYPKKTTKLTISFEHPEYLQTTYPKFYSKWEVIAHSNGDLYDNENHYYYALYWDEAKVHNVDFSTGYYVEREDAISFLEKKLDYIGLSEKEKNEFIMYWLPVLEKNEKNLVYFELTEERERYNKIHINPEPDSLLRLVIHIKKVDQKVEIPKQILTKFQRKGFVAVEWGGTTY